MKAAITATLRGHMVYMYEEKEQLGGVLHHTDHLQGKEELKRYLKYLNYELQRLSVKVYRNHHPSRSEIEKLHPDAIFLALGAKPKTLPVNGIENAITALEAYERIETLKGKYVILGGGSIGCELAIELDKRGCEVSVIEASDRLHQQGNKAYDLAIDEALASCSHLYLYTEAKCFAIHEEMVEFMDKDQRKQQVFGKAILACGMVPNAEACREYEGICLDTYRIGDCRRVGKIRETVEDGTFLPYYL